MWNLIFFLLCALLGASLKTEAAVPNVVVTIKPIHSLVVGIMDGVKMPALLMEGERSPHTQPLTPSEVRQIAASRVVIWVGPSYETPLRRVMGSLKKYQQVITLLEQPGIRLYRIREGGLWGNHDYCGDHCEGPSDQDTDDSHSIDGHLWLDPYNAKVIVKAVARKLSALDPENKKIYFANSQKLMKRLEDLDRELKILLDPVRNKPYVVYHDGMQYFDRHFKTKGIGALIGGGHYGINAQHFLRISQYIRTHKIRCIFTEPQFPTDKIDSLMGKSGTHIETLDYLGIGLKADEHAYFLMMRRLAHGLLTGLKKP
jgi:zinc transport system substrate-binding protein